MPKLIDFFNVAELISVEKLSDMSDEKWNWRIDYVGYQCELFILESEEENKGKDIFTSLNTTIILKQVMVSTQ